METPTTNHDSAIDKSPMLTKLIKKLKLWKILLILYLITGIFYAAITIDCAMGCPVTLGRIVFVFVFLVSIIITSLEFLIMKALITLQNQNNEKKKRMTVNLFIIFAISNLIHRMSFFIWLFPFTTTPYALEKFGVILNGISCPIASIGYCVYLLIILDFKFSKEMGEKKQIIGLYVLLCYFIILILSVMVLYLKFDVKDIFDYPYFIVSIYLFYWVGQPFLVILEIFIPILLIKFLKEQGKQTTTIS